MKIALRVRLFRRRFLGLMNGLCFTRKKKNNVFEIVALYTSPGRCKLIMNSEEFFELIIEITDDKKIFKNVDAYNEASMKSISLNPEETILDRIDEYYEQNLLLVIHEHMKQSSKER